MARNDTLPSTLRITDLEGAESPFVCDCVFIPHAETGLRYATIELYGREEQHRILQSRAGDLVRFEHLIETSERSPREPDGLGRILGGGWTWGTSVGASEIQKIGTIRVLRYNTYLCFPAKAGRNRLSYVFHRQVKDWLEGGMFEISYDGSIKKRKFKTKENLLFSNRWARGEAYRNYFYINDDDKLIRFGLPSILFTWREGGPYQIERLVDSARTLLKFVHGVELRPILRHVSVKGEDTLTVWPSDVDREPTRHRMEAPIFFSEVPAFLREGVKSLASSEHNLIAVEDAVDRYLHATTKVTIEQSFASGCEAIEALFKLVQPDRQGLTGESTVLFTAIKSLSRRIVTRKAARSEINGRIKNALLPGLWPRVYAFVRASRTGLDDECEQLLDRCQFHRYRSQFIHGARAASNHEMFVQRDLLDYVFVSLFLHLLQDRTRRPPITDLLRSELGGTGRPIRLIQIYD